MADLRVGVDACVLIEAIRLEPQHPSRLVLDAARAGVFTLLLVRNAEEEARRALLALDQEPDLDQLLGESSVEPWPAPSAEEVLAAAEELLPLLQHLNDLPLAVALRQARPDAFVSSNRRHWRRALEVPLGGVRIFRPRGLLRWIGLLP